MGTEETASAIVTRLPHLSRVADWILEQIEDVGRMAIMVASAFRALPRAWRSRKLILEQMVQMGFDSMPLVALISLFTGAVAAWQAAYQIQGFVPIKYLGSIIGRNVMIELGPVLTALVVAGRIGAAMAAELGTMKVTEQIDALESMGIPPARYLVMPRFVSATLMLPVLVIFADFLAIFGGYVVANVLLDINTHTYVIGLRHGFQVRDALAGLTKAGVFGMFMAIMGCHYGMRTEGGAEGVGSSTMKAVVASCVAVLVGDYFLTTFLFPISGR